MTLKLFDHPLSSYCWKVLIALYELGAPFERETVNYGDPASRDAFFAMWPLGKIPVLRDGDLAQPETSVIVERVDRLHAAGGKLIPNETEAALQVRYWDRVFDFYVMTPMQKIVADTMRADGEHDPRGVADARALIRNAYGVIDAQMKGREWAAGDAFSLADCAAAPSLFYARVVEPFGAHTHIDAYFERLVKRPSVARVLEEAKPFFQYYPYKQGLEARFLDGGKA